MSYITGTSISYSYPDSCFNILEDLSFKINPESKIGLIGANGCGKTTLFKIISKQISDFDGSISKHRNLKIGLLPQEIDFSAAKTPAEYIWLEFPQLFSIQNEIKHIEASQTETSGIRLGELYSRFSELDGYNVENRINKLTNEFGFTYDRLSQDIANFSGGEKTKLGLVKLLADKPDLLLLDEPTNHLDLETLSWLESYLSKLKIPYVVISHDRKFLDKAVNSIWLLKSGKIKEFTGNYSFFKDSSEAELERQKEMLEQKKKEISRLKKSASSQRTEANSIENFKFKRSIAKNGAICKRDAGSGSGVRIQNKQKAANVIEKRLERKIQEAEDSKPFIEKKRSIHFEECHLKNRTVLKVGSLCKSFETCELFKNLNFWVENGESLAIKGPNGSGKTTLLRILFKKDSDFTGEISWAPKANIGYYAQEFEQLDPTSSILDEVIQGNYEEQTRARIILGSLRLEKDKVNQKISTLSIGEKSKTALAKLLFSNPDVMLLDEPTNHLEIQVRESLENALLDYKGTIILVSHDRYFCEKIATRSISL